jgi:hypothetical protein
VPGEHRQKLHLKLALTLVAVGGALAVVAPGVAAAAAPTYNMTGTWTTGYREGSAPGEQNGTWDITTMSMSTGAFSGTAEVEGVKFTLTGTESGAEVQQELTEGGYTAHDTYTLSVLSSGHVGTNNGTFEGGGEFWAELTGSAEEAAKKAKEEAEAAEKTAKRATSTSVTCNYEFATSENTCVASVGDGGSGTPVTPTGSVTFTTTRGGFTSGAGCSLAPTSGSPSVASCTLVFFTTESGLPTITATYGGDSRHAGSSGHTQFLGMGTEGTYEEPAGPSGQYSNEVILNTEVPIGGTTVEGTVQSSDPDPAPVPMTLPATTGLDTTSAGDLGLVEADAKKVDDSGAQNAKDLKELNEAIEKLDARTIQVKNSPSSTEQAEFEVLEKDVDETVKTTTNMLKKQNQAAQEIVDKLVKNSVYVARNGARKQRTRLVKPLAYIVKRDVAAGKLQLKLRLNRAALDKLAGKRSSVTVVLRVDMLLPSSVYSSGVPRSFAESITLKRAPKHTKHKK